MNLTQTCSDLLAQLEQLVSSIRDEDFSRPSQALGHSTIGQHIRHTLEFFICFEEGFHRDIVNYDKRAHDRLIETDRSIALYAIERISQFIGTLDRNKTLKLEVGYNPHSDDVVTIDTNTFRELVYNIEHTVHHMAIMKIGIGEVAPYIILAEDFGTAVSTIKHRAGAQQRHHS
jgi:uncharacterized damage-inducible protein DinB